MPATVAPASDEADLWRRLRASGEDAAREALLAMHLPYAKVVAASYYAKRFHDEIEFGDYLQLASIGLLEALARYDPQRGVQFRTFAARRMHGSILNGLERLTEKQTQIAARQRMHGERVHDVKAMAGYDGQVPGHPEQLLRVVSEIGIGLALCWLLDGTSMVEPAAGSGQDQPFYRSVALVQLRERLLHAVDGLPAQQRAVIRYHYLQERPFEEIATMLGLTKGRISQVHKQALLHLRAAVRDDSDWDAAF